MATRTKARASEAPDAPPKFIFTSDMADKARQHRSRVQEFELTNTLPGAIARVQVVDMQNPASILVLPDRLTRKVLDIQKEVRRLQKELPTDGAEDAEDITVDAALDSAKLLKRTYDLYTVAGFVEPEVVLTEMERSRDDQVLVDDIHPADRQRFFEWCQEQVRGVSQPLDTFRGGSGAVLGTGGPDGTVGESAERTAAPTGDGNP